MASKTSDMDEYRKLVLTRSTRNGEILGNVPVKLDILTQQVESADTKRDIFFVD